MVLNLFMSAAVEEARSGMRNNEGGPFGAVIVKDGRIISKAHNEVTGTNDPTAHAEVVAIRKASSLLNNHDLSGCEIYATTRPCPMCLSAIMWARIDKVHYGTNTDDVATIGFDDGMIYSMIRGKPDPSVLKEYICECDQCRDLLVEWSKKEDKKMY